MTASLRRGIDEMLAVTPGWRLAIGLKHHDILADLEAGFQRRRPRLRQCHQLDETPGASLRCGRSNGRRFVVALGQPGARAPDV